MNFLQKSAQRRATLAAICNSLIEPRSIESLLADTSVQSLGFTKGNQLYAALEGLVKAGSIGKELRPEGGKVKAFYGRDDLGTRAYVKMEKAPRAQAQAQTQKLTLEIDVILRVIVKS